MVDRTVDATPGINNPLYRTLLKVNDQMEPNDDVPGEDIIMSKDYRKTHFKSEDDECYTIQDKKEK